MDLDPLNTGWDLPLDGPHSKNTLRLAFSDTVHHLLPPSSELAIDAVDSYILLLEAAFSYILWTMRTVNKDHGMSSMYL